jgi:hypothetical protein
MNIDWKRKLLLYIPYISFGEEGGRVYVQTNPLT